MFTGIIQEIGAIGSVTRKGAARRIECIAPGLRRDAIIGESIAIDGVCLTLAAVGPDSFSADAVEETMARTTLSRLSRGAMVNLERAVRAGEPLGGHLVQGHVDCTGEVVGLEDDAEGWILRFRYPAEYTGLVVPKGSIAVDGVSLTIAARDGDERFSVSVIPFTREHTTLHSLRVGRVVNLEFDIIGKYILNAMRAMRPDGALSADRLRELGY